MLAAAAKMGKRLHDKCVCSPVGWSHERHALSHFCAMLYSKLFGARRSECRPHIEYRKFSTIIRIVEQSSHEHSHFSVFGDARCPTARPFLYRIILLVWLQQLQTFSFISRVTPRSMPHTTFYKMERALRRKTQKWNSNAIHTSHRGRYIAGLRIKCWRAAVVCWITLFNHMRIFPTQSLTRTHPRICETIHYFLIQAMKNYNRIRFFFAVQIHNICVQTSSR